MENFFSNFFRFFGGLISFSIFTFIFIYIIDFAKTIQLSRLLLIIETIALSLLFLLVTYFLNKYLSRKFFLFTLLIFSFSIRLIWIIYFKTPVESDFSTLYKAALDASTGNFNFMQHEYYQSYPYQLGIVLYESLIIFLFGKNIFWIQFFNIIFCVVTILTIFLIIEKIVNKPAAIFGSLLYSIYPASLMMMPVLTNQHLATCLFYLGIYLIINNSRKNATIIGGVLIAFGHIFRPIGPIILLAFLVFLIFFQIYQKDKKEVKKSFLTFLKITMTYVLIIFCFNSIAQITRMSPTSVTNSGDSYWKFVLGFNHKTTGQYSTEDAKIIGNIPFGEKRDIAEKEIIKERLKDPKKVLILMKEKEKIMWSRKDSSIDWGLADIKNISNLFIKNMDTIQRCFYASIIFFALIGSGFSFNNNKNFYIYFFIILFIGYFFAHTLIEIQTRYRYFAIPSIIIIASFGFNCIIEKTNDWLARFEQ